MAARRPRGMTLPCASVCALLALAALPARVDTFSRAAFASRFGAADPCSSARSAWPAGRAGGAARPHGLRMSLEEDEPGQSGRSGEESADSIGSFGRGAMGVLTRRISNVRTKMVEKDRVCARNWRNGNMEHYLLDAIDDVRCVALSGSLLAYGTKHGACFVTQIDMDALAARAEAKSRAERIMSILEEEDGDLEAAVEQELYDEEDEEDVYVRSDSDLFSSAIEYSIVGLDSEITAVAFDGKWLCVGYVDGALAVYDIYEPGEPVFLARDAHKGTRVTGISFVPLVSSEQSAAADADADGADGAADGAGAAAAPEAAAGTPDAGDGASAHFSQRIATVGLDGRLRLWNFGEGRSLADAAMPSPATCVSCADGYLVCGLMDGRVVAHAEGLQWRPVLQVSAHDCAVRSLFFDRQDRLLTGGADGTIKYWNLNPDVDWEEEDGGENGEEVMLRAHEGAVVAMQADDSKLVTASQDGSVRVWPLSAIRKGDVDGLLPQFSIQGFSGSIRSVAFEGPLLVSDGTSDRLVIHDFLSPDGEDEIVLGFEG